MFPDTVRNGEGRIVLIDKRSFGPLESYTFGIDADNEPFQAYEWLENDLYDDNFFIHITKKELAEQIEKLVIMFAENRQPEWAEAYQKILDGLGEGHSF